MTEISPTYYADHERVTSYAVVGSGFANLPADAVAIAAVSNDDPLRYRYDTPAYMLFNVNVTDNNRLECVVVQPNSLAVATYLGAILSADHRIVYWKNETRPLP